MHRAIVALWLTGCVVDSTLAPKDGAPGSDDDGRADSDLDDSGGSTVPEERCNGVDDDGDGQIDEGFADADANGVLDCFEAECPALSVGEAGVLDVVEACRSGAPVPPVADPWTADVVWTYAGPPHHDTIADDRGGASPPLVGPLDDDDGDGDIDVHDRPNVVLSTLDGYGNASIVALDGANGREVWEWRGAGAYTGVAIADIDADGLPDVLGYDAAGHPVALEGDGALKWTADVAADLGGALVVTAADLDNDGRPEVIAGATVLDGATGALRFMMEDDGLCSVAAVADADQDGDQEVFYAGRAHDSDGTELWDAGVTTEECAWPVVVQADGDPAAEIGWIGDRFDLYEHDGTPIHSTGYPARDKRPWTPCVGDFDGDGAAELAFGAPGDLYLYELDGTLRWSQPGDFFYVSAGCSGFDVNGDGALEVLYQDMTSMGFVDGVSGDFVYVAEAAFGSIAWPYPTVADLDGDGHTEILYTNNNSVGTPAVSALTHAGAGWPAAEPSWPLGDFAMTNADPDAGVPLHPEPYWSTFQVYRARVASDDAAAADLVVSVTDVCVADCDNGPVQVAVQVGNQGATDVPPGTSLALYALDHAPRLVATRTLPEIPAGTLLDGILFELGPEQIGANGFAAEVDGIDHVYECDEGNNSDGWIDAPCP